MALSFIRRASDPSVPSILCCAPPTRTAARNMLQSTVIWPFTSITVGSTVFSIGVRNNSQITRETLPETTVAANCMSPGIPDTEQETCTCKSTMPATESFKCLRTIIPPFFIKKVGTLNIVLDQSSGIFTFTASTAKDVKIQRITFNGRIKNGRTIPLSEILPVRSNRVTSFDPFSVSFAKGMKNCCGMPLRITIKYTLKNKKNGKTGSRKIIFQYRMECKTICKNRGKAVPFSSKQACPRCRL